jgi:6-phospho-beta-glucosidase
MLTKNEGLPLTFAYEMDPAKALPGSDFVLSCFRTGGLKARYLDETIPEKYQELGIETVGVGGVFMALRCIPEVVKLAQAVQKHCPRAMRLPAVSTPVMKVKWFRASSQWR